MKRTFIGPASRFDAAVIPVCLASGLVNVLVRAEQYADPQPHTVAGVATEVLRVVEVVLQRDGELVDWLVRHKRRDAPAVIRA